MFEWLVTLVRQLLLGYLGLFIKDLHREQLMVKLWNGEVLLENVELMLEAFEYLQLPFALKQGWVGRLSIKIPWKKLGWDPIIVIIEDVLICFSPRDDHEWSWDAIDRREFAGKKAKLVKAELAKLSRRVCDNQAGNSFMSYITAKILDGIHVSIRNVHIQYHDLLTDLEQTILGVKFSSLTITKQNVVGFPAGKVRGGQVNKHVEVQGFEIYCKTYQDPSNSVCIDNEWCYNDVQLERNEDAYLLAPVDFSLSLLVNRSGKLDKDAPQYSITARLTNVVLSVDEFQLQRILAICDNLCICQLREKYGRYRPWGSPLLKKFKGWQRAWWKYAQQAVLVDVRRNLRTSWKYLGERLNHRRKYVQLYKTKLQNLQKEQIIDDNIHLELEKMEKEYEIDDILSYRSVAEKELQELLTNSSSSSGTSDVIYAGEKPSDDERSYNRSRGWLNWLSRGMLGVGGTEDSCQFSGVVSDEVIKDIYEATEFHPVQSHSGDDENEKFFLSSIKFSFDQITLTLQSIKYDQTIAFSKFHGIYVECKIWEKSASITGLVNSVEIVNPITSQVILFMSKLCSDNNLLEVHQSSLNVQVDIAPVNVEIDLFLKVMVQPLKLTFDPTFFINILEFYNGLRGFRFQQERVLLSINRMEDIKARLGSKVEYVLSSRKRVMWNVKFTNIRLVFPWETSNFEAYEMVLESDALSVASQFEQGPLASDIEQQANVLKAVLDSVSRNYVSFSFQLNDLYDLFEVKLSNFEVKISMPCASQHITVLEKLSTCLTLMSCIIPDESVLKNLLVYITLSPLHAHFSPSTCGAVLVLIDKLKAVLPPLDSKIVSAANLPSLNSKGPKETPTFCFCVSVKIDTVVFQIDLDSDANDSCRLALILQGSEFRFAQMESKDSWFCVDTFMIVLCSGEGEGYSHTLCSSRMRFPNHSEQHRMEVETGTRNEKIEDRKSFYGCFSLQYRSQTNSKSNIHRFEVCLDDIELNCYPHIIGLMIGALNKIIEHNVSNDVENLPPVSKSMSPLQSSGFEFEVFDYSKVFETASQLMSNSMDCFPFVTIYNDGSLLSLESSLIRTVSDGREVIELKEDQFASPKLDISNGFEFRYMPPLKSQLDEDAWLTLQSPGAMDLFGIDIRMNNIKANFHDSSCIIGTLSLPSTRCSASIYGDCLDFLCSTEGLSLSSSWWTYTFNEFLWGPLVPNICPILNIRVRRGFERSLGSRFEISFGVQHVFCILPPEFIAIIIGYFSLPEWRCTTIKLPPKGKLGVLDSEHSSVTYKFEILNSVLFTPVEENKNQFLKLDIRQLYGCFIQESNLSIALKGIPSECLVPPTKIASKNNCLNLFGRNLLLSLLLLKDDPALDINAGDELICFISPINADVWVRIPCEADHFQETCSGPTCIMVKVKDFHLFAEGGYVFVGWEALVNVIDQFSSVDTESSSFTSNILQFRQLKKTSRPNSRCPLETSNVTLMEIKCCVNNCVINLNQLRKEFFTPDVIAKAEIQFVCSASFKNEKRQHFDISISSLTLLSFVKSEKAVTLVGCSSDSIACVADIDYLISDNDEHELLVSAPYLTIWLYLVEWNKVIDLLDCYCERIFKTSIEDASSEMKSSSSENENRGFVSLFVRSKDVGMTIHIPFIVGEEPLVVEECLSDLTDETRRNFVTINLNGGYCELSCSNRTTEFSFNLARATGTVDSCGNKDGDVYPLFELLQVNICSEIVRSPIDNLLPKVEVECERLDVSLSQKLLYFWKSASFDILRDGSSQVTLMGMDLDIHARRACLLLIDGRWSFSGPLLEILTSNLLLHVSITEDRMQVSIASDLLVNYNNIHKASWEPFVEPWKFQLDMTRMHEKNVLRDSAMKMDIHFTSTAQLNFNITESLVETLYRTLEMMSNAWDITGNFICSESHDFLNPHVSNKIYNGKHAPYVLQNLTCLPLVFNVCQGPLGFDKMGMSELRNGIFVQPGSLCPIYIEETPEEQLCNHKHSLASVKLSDKELSGVVHHYIILQLEGTSAPSAPISIDLVGIRYFNVDFSKPSSKLEVDKWEDSLITNVIIEENKYLNAGFIVPVVLDVSIYHNIKLVRLYSTVVLLNSTSVPFEIRFDIPLGLSPKVVDPIYPGQQFPLPVHLAQAGSIRWRPLGNKYLWSEAYNISNILSHDSKFGFMRSFVSYPSRPSCDLFRCCISVQEIFVDSSRTVKQGSPVCTYMNMQQQLESSGRVLDTRNKSQGCFIHCLNLCSPFILKNFLPEALSLTMECGGVTRDASLTEVETSFFHVDSSHDLSIVFHLHGYKPCSTKYPRAETFAEMAKFSGTKFSVSENVAFYSDSNDGLIYVTIEKEMNASSGAREVCVYVPFLLYNCTGLSLIVSNPVNEMKGYACIVPSCYSWDEQGRILGRTNGIGLLSCNQHDHSFDCKKNIRNFPSEKYIAFPTTKAADVESCKFLPYMSTSLPEHIKYQDADMPELSGSTLNESPCSSRQLNLQGSNFRQSDYKKMKATMYSPSPNCSSNATAVMLSRCSSGYVADNIPTHSWSSPFFLVPPTGSTSVLVPQLSTNGAYIVSVTSSSSISEPLSGRTRIVTFQPRFVISNGCSKELCYKQKGTDTVYFLGIGQHSHLHWTDTTRVLLVSLCFDEPGWQWSGCFLPEHLGDTQVRMRNFVSGEVSIIRVEVQNASVSDEDEKIIHSAHGNTGTSLVLISEDDTGFMPYRIDNFTKERLRIYQHSCEAFETTVLPYTSCPYAWDEPFSPHRLTIEVAGERILGSYSIDDVKEYPPACLASTSEKPRRTLLVSIHAEGAIKVLSIVDSRYHTSNDTKASHLFQPNRKRDYDQKHETALNWKEKISVVLSFIGVSIINSHAQELLFACAKDTKIDFIQCLDQQKVFFRITSFQIDNQLHGTPYPVMLSFNHEKRSIFCQLRAKDDSIAVKGGSTTVSCNDSFPEPAFSLAVGKWRNEDTSVVSFEQITLRVADCWLQLEQEVILSLFEFLKNIYTRSHVVTLQNLDSTVQPYLCALGFGKESYNDLEIVNGEQKSHGKYAPLFMECSKSYPLSSQIIPIGAPWQLIRPLERRQKKVYVELLDVGPIKLTLSFSSSPWVLRNGVLTSGESLVHRGLMALADVEGAQIHLKQVAILHQLASWESMQGILMRNYTRQLLHEMYKIFGSAGVIGNPMGFMRSMGTGIKDFLSVPATNVLQNPAGIITGMAQGARSLISNTIYAISDATTQFSRTAHKGIVAFTFDELAVANIEKQLKGVSSHKGVINEFFEGLTGLLQLPVKGAEKHGLPGVFSGIALGVSGLVARPAASIFEVTGQTAQSIRNRSKLHHIGTPSLRVRLPRPLSHEFPIRPYSWEEAVGISVLSDIDGATDLKTLVLCKALKEDGKFVIISKKAVLVVSFSSLINLGKPSFQGIPANPKWMIESEVTLDSVIHVDAVEGTLQLLGLTGKQPNPSPQLWPLFQTNLEFMTRNDAENFLKVLLSIMEKGKERGQYSIQLLHQNNLRTNQKPN